MNNVINELDVMKVGFRLLIKKDKTKEEKKASKSFKKSFALLCLITFIWILIFTIVTLAFYPSRGFEGTKRYGVVEGNNVKYANGNNKYLPINSLDINVKNLKEGDSVLLFFDSNEDILIKAIPNSEYKRTTNQRFVIIIGTAIAGIITLSVYVTSGRKTVGKDFYEYINNFSLLES